MLLSLALAVLTAAPPTLGPPAEPMPAALAGSYDIGNPFARVIRGELPAAKVYEDAHVLAFMDHRPVATGHVLVISKTSRARNLLETEPRELARVMAMAQRITRAEFDALGATGVVIVQNNGSAQSVFHLHVHVIPRFNGDGPALPAGGPQQSIAELTPIAQKLAAALRAAR